MVSLSKGTVAFIKATDFLKGVKRIKHGIIAENIGLSRSQYDQSRGGRRVVLEEDIKNLRRIYPEVDSFFNEANVDWKEPAVEYLTNPQNESDLVKSLRETITAKNEIIKLQKEKIKDLELDLKAAQDAHTETLKKLYTEEEAKAEYYKRLEEYEELKKKMGIEDDGDRPY